MYVFVAGTSGRSGYECGCGAPVKCVGHESIAVGSPSGKRDEELAPGDIAGIDADPGERQAGACSIDPLGADQAGQNRWGQPMIVGQPSAVLTPVGGSFM